MLACALVGVEEVGGLLVWKSGGFSDPADCLPDLAELSWGAFFLAEGEEELA